jgi:hypothetical protein
MLAAVLTLVWRQVPLWATWLFYVVLIDLADEVLKDTAPHIADELALPFESISVEMVFRGIYKSDSTHPSDRQSTVHPWILLLKLGYSHFQVTMTLKLRYNTSRFNTTQ